MKVCIICGEEKPTKEFKYQGGKNLYSKTCKKCLRKKRPISVTHGNLVWDIAKIRSGFEQFYEEYGRYPTAPEIDDYPLLPSSRQLQRKWRGLKGIRSKLSLKITDYTTGKYRSKEATKYISIALDSESEVRKSLNDWFGEICVHEEKKYGGGKNTVDFFVYAKDYNFGVEVFKTSGYKNLAKNLNIKLDKYNTYPFRLFFVVMGEKFEQDKIDKLISNKKDKPLLDNMECVTMGKFQKRVKYIKPLNFPFKYWKIHQGAK